LMGLRYCDGGPEPGTTPQRFLGTDPVRIPYTHFLIADRELPKARVQYRRPTDDAGVLEVFQVTFLFLKQHFLDSFCSHSQI
jgi:hypothetical protein